MIFFHIPSLLTKGKQILMNDNLIDFYHPVRLLGPLYLFGTPEYFFEKEPKYPYKLLNITDFCFSFI